MKKTDNEKTTMKKTQGDKTVGFDFEQTIKPLRSGHQTKGKGGWTMNQTPTDCHDCATKPGEQHDPGCDVERCSVCGGQAMLCGCEGHDPAFARWTGFWPGFLEATTLGIDLNTLYSSGTYKLFFIKPEEV